METLTPAYVLRLCLWTIVLFWTPLVTLVLLFLA